MTGYIYCIENKLNGKKYIGQTKTSINKRFLQHINYSTNKNSRLYNKELYKDIRELGKNNFNFYIILEIESCKDDLLIQLNSLEKMFIGVYKSFNIGYNLTNGGGRGIHMSDKTKMKMSECKKGRKFSEEHKNNIAKAQLGEKNHMYGKKVSNETKEKMSKASKGKQPMLGKCHSEETKKKIGEAGKGRKFSEEHKRKISKALTGKKGKVSTQRKKVKDITTGIIYNSLAEASNYTNISIASISTQCNDKYIAKNKNRRFIFA